MGIAKRLLEEERNRRWEKDPTLFVCTRCVGDRSLKSFVFKNRQSMHCTYCGRKSVHVFAAPVYLVHQEIFEAFCTEYEEVSRDIAPYDTEDGEWMVPTWRTEELLQKEYQDSPEKGAGFRDSIVNAFGDILWCRREPITLSEDEALSSAWDQFCQLVKHVTRFMYFPPPDEHFREFEEIHPSQILDELGERVRDCGLIRQIDAGQVFFRIRPHSETQAYATADALGPPPYEHALNSNRMSPAGIPMFYGAKSSETALAETAEGKKGFGTVGTWSTTRPIRVLDLSSELEIPSIFDREKRGFRGAILFLRSFQSDLSAPVKKDQRIHIEYVPTQIVTEYFRHKFRSREGEMLDGILYESARCVGTTSCVLFCASSACINASDNIDSGKTMLRLESACRIKWDKTLRIVYRFPLIKTI